MKKWICLLTVLLLSLTLVFAASADSAPYDERVVYDNNGLLNPDEEAEIRQAVASVRSLIGDASVVVICATDSRSTAKKELAALGYQDGDNVAALVIFETPEGPYPYMSEIYIDGKMDDYISDRTCDNIADEIKSDIHEGRFLEGAKTFVSLISAAYADGIPTPMRPSTKVVIVIVAALVSGLLAGGIPVIVLIFKYRKKNRSASYPLNEYTRLYLTNQKDEFMYHTVTKVKVVSSSSGGSGGGRSSGGGHSSGRR